MVFNIIALAAGVHHFSSGHWFHNNWRCTLCRNQRILRPMLLDSSSLQFHFPRQLPARAAFDIRIIFIISMKKGRFSSVGTATRYGLDGSGIEADPGWPSGVRRVSTLFSSEFNKNEITWNYLHTCRKSRLSNVRCLFQKGSLNVV